MGKCGICGKFLSAAVAAKCTKCAISYHRACASIPELKPVSPSWQCMGCKGITKKGNITTPSPAEHHESQCDDVNTPTGSYTDCTPPLEEGSNSDSADRLELSREIRLFREELREMRMEFADFRRDMAEIRLAISACNNRLDEVIVRVEALEKSPPGDGTSDDLSKLEGKIVQLETILDDREQELLLADLEISKVPEITGENTLHVVTTLASKLGLTLEERDIVFAERVGPRRQKDSDKEKMKDRRIVVRLTHRKLRDELLRNARVRRGADTSGLGNGIPIQKFYINERLTRNNRHLFYRVREEARLHSWKFAWTRRGRIYTRQNEGKNVHCIRTEADLIRVFGKK